MHGPARTANCWCSYERGNAEKSFLGQRILFFSFSLKCKISSLKEKVKIISESELEICALIFRTQLESISVSICLFTSVEIAFERQMFLLAHRLWGTTFTSCQKLLVPMFFFLWRVDYAGGVLRFDWANVILAACFTLRGHDPLIHFLWFLFLVGKMICPMMQDHFCDRFWAVKLFIAAK